MDEQSPTGHQLVTAECENRYNAGRQESAGHGVTLQQNK